MNQAPGFTPPQKKPLTMALWILVGGPLLFIVFLLMGGWMPLLWLVIHIASDGWKPLVVDDAQPGVTYKITHKQQTVEILLTGYELQAESDEVSIEVSVDERVLPAVTSYYDNDWRQFGEGNPGDYKFKDVDGDWRKDVLIRTGYRWQPKQYYYISSRDGSAYKTNETFELRMPWGADSGI